jgi:hypothetical protein
VTFALPKLKSSLKGTHFLSVEDIRKKTVELFEALSKNGCRRCFEAWKARMGRFVASDGNYIEGDNMWLE